MLNVIVKTNDNEMKTRFGSRSTNRVVKPLEEENQFSMLFSSNLGLKEDIDTQKSTTTHTMLTNTQATSSPSIDLSDFGSRFSLRMKNKRKELVKLDHDKSITRRRRQRVLATKRQKQKVNTFTLEITQWHTACLQ